MMNQFDQFTLNTFDDRFLAHDIFDRSRQLPPVLYEFIPHRIQIAISLLRSQILFHYHHRLWLERSHFELGRCQSVGCHQTANHPMIELICFGTHFVLNFPVEAVCYLMGQSFIQPLQKISWCQLFILNGVDLLIYEQHDEIPCFRAFYLFDEYIRCQKMPYDYVAKFSRSLVPPSRYDTRCKRKPTAEQVLCFVWSKQHLDREYVGQSTDE